MHRWIGPCLSNAEDVVEGSPRVQSGSSGLVHLCLHSHCVCGGPVPDKKEPNVHRVAACGWDTSVGVVSSHSHCYFHSKGTYKGGIFSNLSVCLLKAAVWAWFKVVAQYIA